MPCQAGKPYTSANKKAHATARDTFYLPSREDYIEMLGRARTPTAKALEEAKRTGNVTLLGLYHLALADWDRLIARLRDDNLVIPARRKRRNASRTLACDLSATGNVEAPAVR